MVDVEDADLDEERDDYLSTVLPRYKTDKHNIVRCTIDHLATANPSDADINLHLTTHIMGSILTKCPSQRCRANEDGESCWCRYKINTCKVNKTTVVYQQGAHITDDLAAPSPVRRWITPAMKELLKAELDRHPDATPLQLLGLLAFEISNTDLRGPEPSRGQVEYFLRLWRNNHPGADTRQVSSAIDGSLYDEVGLHNSSPRSVVYFSDTVCHGNHWVSRVGVGSDADPYRIGLTCYQLLNDYVLVQQNNERTVIVHLDSTFNTVKQKYPAFVIGYSDRCGHFFPMDYFCTSKRQNADVSWCLRFLQRALRETFNVEFKPTFIVMDGDKAQYKACAKIFRQQRY
ncbi:hypothetical protein PHMEG_00034521 [Phytophthora megakarya]|uniref:MULE transposase domain-containing protein n=1 Tax=Phytophthora megakarya TaxID=4795 RepID=A0A225USE9_9STRA|nr:hypothetical protein PHMEG_00034521 [Phytophthora megakarya]